VFASLDFTSFHSVWYWVLTIVVWTQVCHRTLGVPYDMILRAERLPEVATEVDLLARVAAARVAALHRHLGIWIAALSGFALSALAVLGLANGFEAALATLLLLLPLALVGVQTIRLALFVHRTGANGRELRRRLARRRAWNQVVAFMAIGTATLMTVAFHPYAILLRW
jgi:hypothetical protein